MDIETAKVIGDNLSDVIEGYLGPPIYKGTWFCPFHDDGKNPNLTIKNDKWRCWSSQCNRYGDVLDFIGAMDRVDLHGAMTILTNGQSPSSQEIAERKAEREARQKQRQAALEIVRRAALDSMGNQWDVSERYHSQLPRTLDYWAAKGIMKNTAYHYHLGYCDKCPTYYNPQNPDEIMDSHTIPYIRGGKLYSIRHRLTDEKIGKYRQHKKGLPNMLFNLDGLNSVKRFNNFSLLEDILVDGEAMLFEGETKTMFMSQEGIRSAGIPGALTWVTRWANYFKGFGRVYLALDFDVLPSVIAKIANDLREIVADVRIIQFPVKPDDFFTIYGGTVAHFRSYVSSARTIEAYIY